MEHHSVSTFSEWNKNIIIFAQQKTCNILVHVICINGKTFNHYCSTALEKSHLICWHLSHQTTQYEMFETDAVFVTLHFYA